MWCLHNHWELKLFLYFSKTKQKVWASLINFFSALEVRALWCSKVQALYSFCLTCLAFFIVLFSSSCCLAPLVVLWLCVVKFLLLLFSSLCCVVRSSYCCLTLLVVLFNFSYCCLGLLIVLFIPLIIGCLLLLLISSSKLNYLSNLAPTLCVIWFLLHWYSIPFVVVQLLLLSFNSFCCCLSIWNFPPPSLCRFGNKQLRSTIELFFQIWLSQYIFFFFVGC
jgi:hypothetical protein